MAKPQSTFLITVVAVVLGFALGVVTVAGVSGLLNTNARDAANQLENPAPGPQLYGNR
jgi:hypothetical protein